MTMPCLLLAEPRRLSSDKSREDLGRQRCEEERKWTSTYERLSTTEGDLDRSVSFNGDLLATEEAAGQLCT
jgi:hypothetical protein